MIEFDNEKKEQNAQQDQAHRDDPFAASDMYSQSPDSYFANKNDPYSQHYGQNIPKRPSFLDSIGTQWDFQSIIGTVFKALLFVLLFIGIQTVVVLAFQLPIAFELIAQSITDDDELNRLMMERLSPYSNYLSALAGVLTVISVFILAVCQRKNPIKELSFTKTKISTIILCIIAGIALNFSCNVLFMFMPQEWLAEYSQASESLETGSLLSYIISGVIIAPITEELIFRASVMKRFSKCMPAIFASLLSAIVFGVCHGDLVWAIYAGSLGFIIGLVFARFDSIIPCITIHLAFNSVSAVQQAVYEIPAIKNMTETQELLFNGVYTILCFVMLAISVALVTILLTNEKLLVRKNIREDFLVNE